MKFTLRKIILKTIIFYLGVDGLLTSYEWCERQANIGV